MLTEKHKCFYNEVLLTISEISKKYNFDLEKNIATINNDLITFKAHVSWNKAGYSRLEREYIAVSNTLGLNLNWLHKIFFYKGKKYQILGYVHTKLKKPIGLINIITQKVDWVHPSELKQIVKNAREIS